MTLQQIEERIDRVCKRSWRVQDTYGTYNLKANRVLRLLYEEYCNLLVLQKELRKQLPNASTTPQPKYPEGTL